MAVDIFEGLQSVEHVVPLFLVIALHFILDLKLETNRFKAFESVFRQSRICRTRSLVGRSFRVPRRRRLVRVVLNHTPISGAFYRFSSLQLCVFVALSFDLSKPEVQSIRRMNRISRCVRCPKCDSIQVDKTYPFAQLIRGVSRRDKCIAVLLFVSYQMFIHV